MSRTNRQYKGKKYSDKDIKNWAGERNCYLSHRICPACMSNKMHSFKRAATPQDEFENMLKPVIRPHSVLNSLIGKSK